MRRLVLLTVLASCDASPAERCDAYIDLLCERVADCGMLVDGEQMKCITLASQVMSCSRATALGSGYDDCIDHLESGPCEDFVQTTDTSTRFDVPAECHDAFVYVE